MSSNELLGVYLNDHLAGASAGMELAEKLRSGSEGTAFGAVLSVLVAEIKEDRAMLEELTERLGIEKSPVKQAAGWIFEKLSRLRLDQHVTGSPDLSRLLEAETLSLGIEGKLVMWRALKEVATVDARLATTDFDVLIARARGQRESLEPYRQDHRLPAGRPQAPARPSGTPARAARGGPHPRRDRAPPGRRGTTPAHPAAVPQRRPHPRRARRRRPGGLRRVIVLDTSGLLAALDAGQRRHRQARAALAADPGPLLLSPFVLAELDHLLLTRVGVKAEAALLREVAAGAYDLVAFDADDVAAAATLVERYQALQVGVADASVAVIAARSKTTRLLTLDERHFRSIRPLWGEAFTLLPADGA